MINNIPSASVPYKAFGGVPYKAFGWEWPCFHWGSGSSPVHWSLPITGGLVADMKLVYRLPCRLVSM